MFNRPVKTEKWFSNLCLSSDPNCGFVLYKQNWLDLLFLKRQWIIMPYPGNLINKTNLFLFWIYSLSFHYNCMTESLLGFFLSSISCVPACMSLSPSLHRAEPVWHLVTLSAVKTLQQKLLILVKTKDGDTSTPNVWKSGSRAWTESCCCSYKEHQTEPSPRAVNLRETPVVKEWELPATWSYASIRTCHDTAPLWWLNHSPRS